MVEHVLKLLKIFVCSVHLTVRAPPEGDWFRAAAAGDPEWLNLSLRRAVAPLDTDQHVSADSSLYPEPSLAISLHLNLKCASRYSRCTCISLSNVSDASLQGASALHAACLHGLLACVELLVERGLVDVNSRCGHQGRRPVHAALSAPRSSPDSASACLRYLLDHGADVNVYGCTSVTLTFTQFNSISIFICTGQCAINTYINVNI